MLSVVSVCYPCLQGKFLTRYSPVRLGSSVQAQLRQRLACVKHSVSVHPEPGSNSSFNIFLIYFISTLVLTSFLPSRQVLLTFIYSYTLLLLLFLSSIVLRYFFVSTGYILSYPLPFVNYFFSFYLDFFIFLFAVCFFFLESAYYFLIFKLLFQ